MTPEPVASSDRFRVCGLRGRRTPGPQVKGSKRIASEVSDPPQPEPADSGAGPVTVRSFNRLRDDVDSGEARGRQPKRIEGLTYLRRLPSSRVRC